MNRNIEPSRNSVSYLTDLFHKYSDLTSSDGQKNLSFDKFAVLCVELNIFSDESQNNFLECVDEDEVNLLFLDVKDDWPETKKEIEHRIYNIPHIDKEELE